LLFRLSRTITKGLQLADEHDDPILKSAVQRVWGGQTAPDELRRRIRATLAGSRSAWWQRPIGRASAIAALLLVGVGVAMFVMRGPAISGTKMPQTIADNLIQTHKSCFSRPSHHLLPADAAISFDATGQYLANQLKIHVISTDIGNGWTFDGAGMCRVGSRFTGHLIFRRNGTQELSIFSVPQDTGCNGMAAETSYSYIENGYWLAGFTHGDGLYCLVARDPNGGLTTQELESIRTRLRTNFSAVALSPGKPMNDALALRVATIVLAERDEGDIRPICLRPAEELIHAVNP